MISKNSARVTKSLWLLCVLMLILALSPLVAAASKSPISEFSASLKRRLSESKVRSLVIADFTDSAGKPVPEGIYFADLLHLYLAEPPQKLSLASRDLLRHELQRHKLSPADLTSAETLHLLRAAVPVEAIVSGTVDETPQQVLLRVFARRISDQTVIADLHIAMEQSEFFKSLFSYPNYLTPSEVFRAGENGVDPPECEDCPAPQFRGPAEGKTDKSRNTAILLGLVITKEGRVASVKVLQGAGPEFEDMAWRGVRSFRFKPARNKAGNNVAAVIPMQIFFTVTVDY